MVRIIFDWSPTNKPLCIARGIPSDCYSDYTNVENRVYLPSGFGKFFKIVEKTPIFPRGDRKSKKKTIVSSRHPETIYSIYVVRSSRRRSLAVYCGNHIVPYNCFNSIQFFFFLKIIIRLISIIFESP